MQKLDCLWGPISLSSEVHCALQLVSSWGLKSRWTQQVHLTQYLHQPSPRCLFTVIESLLPLLQSIVVFLKTDLPAALDSNFTPTF